jgi:hypothetical protein
MPMQRKASNPFVAYGKTRQSTSGDWRDDAACFGADPELFFPEGAKRQAALQAEVAKRICKSCVVVETCLNGL